MLEKFKQKKSEILDSLLKSDDDYTDASPKGSVDEGIRELVREINDIDGLVTTSSCSGRISVFLEGAQKPSSVSENQHAGEEGRSERDGRNAKASEEGKSGKGARSAKVSVTGKGGGKWLFASHIPLNHSQFSTSGALFRQFGFTSNVDVSFPSAEERPQFVHFKFEPMILHIVASTIEEAQAVLNAAVSAGFRESGISGVLDTKNRASTPMVAVRSSGPAFDSIIGFQSQNMSSPVRNQITPMVSESYLRTLIQLANERFSNNDERKARFRNALFSQPMLHIPIDVDSTRPDYVRRRRSGAESKAARSQRKQQAKLTRKDNHLQYAGNLDGLVEGSADGPSITRAEGNEYDGLDLLMEEETDGDFTNAQRLE